MIIGFLADMSMRTTARTWNGQVFSDTRWRNNKRFSVGTVFRVTIAGGILASATPVWADPGHAPGVTSAGRPGAIQQATRTIDVVMDDELRYTPSTVDVRNGETVRFVLHNVGQMRHEFVLGTWKELREYAASVRKYPETRLNNANAVSVEPDHVGVAVWQFTHSGRFLFGCLMPGHYEAGMVGHIEVLEIRGGTGPAPANALTGR